MKRLLLLLAMLLSFLGLRAASEPLEIGAAVPAVTAVDDAGRPFDFAAYCATGYALVYFYPKANTPGCTAQGCSLRDAYAELTAKGVKVVGVSTDAVAAQRAFRAKYAFPFPLVADPEKKVTAAFGVPTTLGFAARQAYLFKDGKLVWRDLKASTAEQAADVRKVVQSQ